MESNKDVKNIRILNTSQSIAYSMAAFGLMLPVSLYNGFSYYFIVYIVGLSPIFGSIGNSLGLFLNAIVSPLAGFLSDQKKPTKFGRRKPYLLIGAPLMSIGFFFLWFWPDWLSIATIGQLGVAIIYWIASAVFCIFNSYAFPPYTSMLPEISNVNENRIKIAGIQGMANLVGTVVGMIFPFLIKSFASTNEELIFWMTIIGLGTCIFSIITIYITVFVIHEPIEELVKSGKIDLNLEKTSNKQNKSEFSLISLFKDILSPLKNKDFNQFAKSNFFFNLGMRIPMTILIPLLEIVIGVKSEDLIIFILIVLPFAVAGFVLWTKLSGKIGLIKTLKYDYYIMIAFMGGAIIFIGINNATLKIIIGLIMIIVVITALIAIYVIPAPAISKMVDKEIENTIASKGPFENEDEKYKFAGKFFGVNSFLLNLAQAISFLILGPILEANKEDPIILTICMPITAFIVLISVQFLKKVEIEKDG
ncbi:MAG: MFS transporter [Promethearchaeota archaeon]